MTIDFSQLSDEELYAIVESPEAPQQVPQAPSPQDAYIRSIQAAGTPLPEGPSMGGSAAREFGRSLIPAGAGIGVGALSGAAGGAWLGPPGAIGGAIIGGLASAFAARSAQDYIADQVAPNSFMGTQSAAQDYQANPISSILGGAAAGGRPSISNLTTAARSLTTAEGRALAAQGLRAMAQKGGAASPQAIRAAESLIDVPVGAGLNAGMTIAQGGSLGDVLRDAGIGALFSKSWIPGMSMNPASRITPEEVPNPVPAPDMVQSRELVPYSGAPYADVEVVRPSAGALPMSGTLDFPEPGPQAFFRPPAMLESPQIPLSLPRADPLQLTDQTPRMEALPPIGGATALDPMQQVRNDRTAEITQQIKRLTARRDALKQRGEKAAAAKIDKQIKLRTQALKSIESTIYADAPAQPEARPVEERYAAGFRPEDRIEGVKPETVHGDITPQEQAIQRAAVEGIQERAPIAAEAIQTNLPEQSSTPVVEAAASLPDGQQLSPRGDGIHSVYEAARGGKKEWRVQASDKRGFGDWIFDTKEEADAAASIEKRNAEQRANTMRELSKMEESEAKAKSERENLDGFGDDLTPMKKGAIVKQLTTLVNYRGQEMTKRDLIRKMVAEGRRVEAYQGERILTNDKGEFLGQKILTKAGLDYAEFLSSKKSDLPQSGDDDINGLFGQPTINDEAKLRAAIAKADEDIAAAKEDGDSYGQRGLELAKRKLEQQLEAIAPNKQADQAPASPAVEAPQKLSDRIRGKKLKIDKGKLHMVIFPGLDEVTAKTIYNGALEVAALAVDAGDRIGKAVNKAIQWLKQNHPNTKFNEQEVRRALEADTITTTEEIKATARAADTQKQAAAMDANPDSIGKAEGDPLKTFIDESAEKAGERWDSLKNGTTFRKARQAIHDANRRLFKGVASGLEDLAKGGSSTGKNSPALEKLNRAIFGTRPGADGVGSEGLYADMITRSRAKMEELGRIFDLIRKDYERLDGNGQEAMIGNMVKWMQAGDYKTKLAIQPKIVEAIDGMKKLFRSVLNDMREAGIPIGDAGEDYFTRVPNADAVKRGYESFVDSYTGYYKEQAIQDGKPITDAEARAKATAYADSIVLGEFGFKQDGSDLNLMAKQGGNPDFMKARAFTGEVSKKIDREMGPKFFERNPFVAAQQQIRASERKIAMAKAFGKISEGPDGKPVLDPVGKWNEFTQAAIKEGNAGLVAEARNLYQAAFGLGNNFDTKTQSFVNLVRNLGYYSYLAYTGISSLTEPTVIAQRMDRPVTGVFKAYGETFRAIARQIRRVPPNELEKLASLMGAAERYGMELAMTMGSVNEMGFKDSKNLAKYFYLTGNSLVSNGTSIAALKMGALGIRAKLLSALSGNRIDGGWLEEAGIKRADFQKLSDWMEVQQSGDTDNLFHGLQGTDAEATTIRKALSKVVREARLSPDASTKNRASGTPFGSLFFSLQSYLYDFADKVLGRGLRRAATGLRGKSNYGGSEIDLTPAERAQLVAPLAFGLPMLLAANFGVGLIRELITPDPERIRRNKDKAAAEINWNRLNRALSRTNVLGPYDILFNAIAQARYERDVAASSVGPYLGGALELLKSATGITGDKNSPNTNTAERKLIRDFVNVGPRPLANLFWSSLPISNPYVKGLAAGGIFATSQPAVREGAVLLGAGPPNVQKKPKAAATP